MLNNSVMVRRKFIGVRVDAETHDWLTRFAEVNATSSSEVARQAIHEYRLTRDELAPAQPPAGQLPVLDIPLPGMTPEICGRFSPKPGTAGRVCITCGGDQAAHVNDLGGDHDEQGIVGPADREAAGGTGRA
jgi:hypothetical protein